MKQTRIFATLGVTASLLLYAGVAFSATPVATTSAATDVEGLVRDVACPIQNHESTATNFSLDCALACARSGSPLIILTKAGDIYFPISDKMPDQANDNYSCHSSVNMSARRERSFSATAREPLQSNRSTR